MIAILFLGECMDNKYLAILVVIFIICIGTFMFQLNKNVATFIVSFISDYRSYYAVEIFMDML